MKLLKILTESSRMILGGAFLFSGFVKSVDPYGTAYKVADYLQAFNMASFSFLEMPISFFLCGFEFALGIVILLGLFPKWSSKLMLLTMCFMTPLTLYLAIANPVSDCGCFGDAIVLSNWETFYKNIVLLTLSLLLVFNYKLIKPFFNNRMHRYVLSFIVLFAILFLFYNYRYDPIIDFRPYKIGINIPQQMIVSDDKRPIVENVFIYEKDGIQKEFTEEDYPWQDSIWIFVSMDTKIIKEGELPPISDFPINEVIFNRDKTDVIDQYDISGDVLKDNNYSFLILAPFLRKVPDTEKVKLELIANYAEKNQYRAYLLTASSTEEILASSKSYKNNIKFCVSDEKILKTIIRSNPGILLIKDGIILGKWGNNSIPNRQEFNKPIEQFISDNKSEMNNGVKVLIIALLLLFPLLVIKGIDKFRIQD